MLSYGYVRDRNDNMSEYVITGSVAVFNVLTLLRPFLILKAAISDKILEIIEKKKVVNSEEDFRIVCSLVDSTELLNYSKNRKNKVVTFLNKKISP